MGEGWVRVRARDRDPDPRPGDVIMTQPARTRHGRRAAAHVPLPDVLVPSRTLINS